MKKILFISLLFTALQPIQAQKWLRNGERWTFHLTGGFAGFNIYFTQKVEKDTIVDGQPCKKVINIMQPNVIGNRYAFADGNKVYAYNEAIKQWNVIYNFDLTAGQQLTVNGFSGPFTYMIESVDEVVIDGKTVKRQRVVEVPEQPTTNPWRSDILEGVGMVGRPFDSDEPKCSYYFVDVAPFCESFVDGYDFTFICYDSEELTYAPFANCTLITGTENPGALATIKVSPNPAGNWFTVSASGDNAINTLKLIDLQGKTLVSMNNMNSISVDVVTADIPSGICLAVIDTRLGQVMTRISIVH